jgi:Ribbon-helix-helix protein, copG family.
MKQVKVSDQLHEKLKELAEKRGVSINQLIEEILNIYLYGATGKTIKRVAVDKEIPASTPINALSVVGLSTPETIYAT